MKKPQEEYVSVWRLAETEDWDGTARVGMRHCEYLHVKQVLREEDGGWWDERYQPYLVFTNVDITEDQASQACDRAIQRKEVRHGLSAPQPERQRDPKVPFAQLDIPPGFAEAARVGMSLGFVFSQVTYEHGENGTVRLTFYNDRRDIPEGSDDPDIDSVIDLL